MSRVDTSPGWAGKGRPQHLMVAAVQEIKEIREAAQSYLERLKGEQGITASWDESSEGYVAEKGGKRIDEDSSYPVKEKGEFAKRAQRIVDEIDACLTAPPTPAALARSIEYLGVLYESIQKFETHRDRGPGVVGAMKEVFRGHPDPSHLTKNLCKTLLKDEAEFRSMGTVINGLPPATHITKDEMETRVPKLKWGELERGRTEASEKTTALRGGESGEVESKRFE